LGIRGEGTYEIEIIFSWLLVSSEDTLFDVIELSFYRTVRLIPSLSFGGQAKKYSASNPYYPFPNA
jgi:hypothetical protein